MTRTLMICPWFGPLPTWWRAYQAQMDRLRVLGYDFLIDTDLDGFRQRVRDSLSIECPITAGSSKIHDYRPALGLLYERETAGYDFWGHTDFDCVYGRPDRFFVPELLGDYDIVSDCAYDYLAGPWTLYRADPLIARMFRLVDGWEQILADPHVHAWQETSFSECAKETVDALIVGWHRFTDPDGLAVDGLDRLFWHGDEISYFHFNRTKTWPTLRVVA